jgi:hypothetical protein
LGPGREVALLRSSIHPAFVIPNPCAFGRVRDLLFVCPWPYPQEVNRAKRNLRVEELESSRVDKKRKGKDLTQRTQRPEHKGRGEIKNAGWKPALQKKSPDRKSGRTFPRA